MVQARPQELDPEQSRELIDLPHENNSCIENKITLIDVHNSIFNVVAPIFYSVLIIPQQAKMKGKLRHSLTLEPSFFSLLASFPAYKCKSYCHFINLHIFEREEKSFFISQHKLNPENSLQEKNKKAPKIL